jgi:hypothetical protein
VVGLLDKRPKSSDIGQAKLSKIECVESATCGVRKGGFLGQASSPRQSLRRESVRGFKAEPSMKLKQLICIAFLTATVNAMEKQMSSELKSRIAWVLVFSFFAFQADIYCQRRVDQWHADQRIRYERAAAQYEAQHPSNPEPVLLDGVWSCEPPSKWHAQRDGGSNAIVCVANHPIGASQ